jgi:hypothetical protein
MTRVEMEEGNFAVYYFKKKQLHVIIALTLDESQKRIFVSWLGSLSVLIRTKI